MNESSVLVVERLAAEFRNPSSVLLMVDLLIEEHFLESSMKTSFEDLLTNNIIFLYKMQLTKCLS